MNRRLFVPRAVENWRGLDYIGLKSGWGVMTRVAGCFLLLLTSLPAAGELLPEQLSALPPAATVKVDFARQIQPIFAESCVKCHGRGRVQGGFSLETRASVLQGGKSGPAVAPGKSAGSLLIELVSGLNPDDIMPKKGKRLTAEQVGLLRAWIDQDLPWNEGVTFARPAPANLIPRKPAVPDAVSGIKNPIDRFLAVYNAAHQFTPPPGVEDRVFLRRLYLDAIGLLPPPEALEAFQRDAIPDKRERWVAKVLADNQKYAEHWLSFWNDALRNDYQGTGYIDGGRKQITSWLFAALAQNLPYDRFVAQLVNPSPECEGFIGGIIWRGTVNASQTPPMQAAQNISHVFMGVNLKCASCHDSFINDWTLADAYGMAGIYADGPLEMVRCDKPTGHQAPVKFLYSELGNVDSGLDLKARRQRLAELLTEKKNGRLSRTIVNRLWAKFMGHGLVEPVDDMEQPAWDQDLLDWLASDLVGHSYDLKHTMAMIFTSEAYRLPAVADTKDYVFHGPRVRRLDAEQYLDAVGDLTGNRHMLPANREIDFAVSSDPAENRQMLGLSTKARRIGWQGTDTNAASPWFLRKTFSVDAVPGEAVVVCASDSAFHLYINGKSVANGGEGQPELADIRAELHAGENVVAVKMEKRFSDPKVNAGQTNVGFLLYARIRSSAGGEKQDSSKNEDFISDASWIQSSLEMTNWENLDFSPEESWMPIHDLTEDPDQSWTGMKAFLSAVSCAAQFDRTRAALVNNDPLMTALGRPNREQTLTARSDSATTLQALELMNGPTLSKLLQQGAQHWLSRSSNIKSSHALIERVYRQALGRAPGDKELDLAAELIGEPAQPEGVEDFLWAMIMLPEFQLIY